MNIVARYFKNIKSKLDLRPLAINLHITLSACNAPCPLVLSSYLVVENELEVARPPATHKEILAIRRYAMKYTAETRVVYNWL